MIFTASTDGRIEFANRRWADFSGREHCAAADDDWTAIVHPGDRDRVRETWRRAREAGEDVAVEARFQRADGSYAWILCNAAPLRDSAGAILRWYGTSVDIDQRKRTEAMLADSERKFRVLGEAIPVICWTADATGWVDWYNHRWYKFTGQTPEQSMGWGWQSVHHPDDFVGVMERWPKSIETGDPFEMEYRLRGHDGVFHWFQARVEPLHDEAGNIIRWYGSIVDIDAHKHALERTKRIVETLQAAFLPRELPHRPNLRLDAIYIPAERDALVGGDWYDAFELPDGRLVFSIGDVTGHGLEASITVGRMRQAIFMLAHQFEDPARILEEADRVLQHQEPGTIVTALVGTIDAGETEMCYASAGHPPPLVAYRNDEPARMMPLGGPPLGTGYARGLTTHRVPLARDAVVALYTDGMTEFARDVVAAERSLSAALALIVGNKWLARPAVTVQEIVLNRKPTNDDVALLLMQFSAVDSPSQRADPRALEKTWRFHSSDAYAAHTTRLDLTRYLRAMAADKDQVFPSELILGEILANTVEHAPGLVEIEVDWKALRPSVIVRDMGPGIDSLAGELPDPMDEGGRGLFLIGTLAEKLEVRRAPGFGTEIRVVLPIARNTTL